MNDPQKPIVRPAKPEEIHTAALVAQIAFESKETLPWEAPAEWLARNKSLDYFVAAEIDGKIVSSLITVPSLSIFGSDVIQLASVGSVATLPEYRRRGCAGAMMEYVVKSLYEKEHVLSALWPFSFPYYRKFGWELGGESKTYNISAEIASSLGEPDKTRPASVADLPAIFELSNRAAKHYNCITVRDAEWWQIQCTMRRFIFDCEAKPNENEIAIWLSEIDGKIEGYCMYKLCKDEKGDTIAEALELTAETNQAKNNLIASMTNTDAQKIVIDLPADAVILSAIENPRAVECKISPGFQFRVVNPKTALKMLTVDPSLTGKIGLSIIDPVLGKTSFTIEAEKGRVFTTEQKRSEEVSMNIQTFSQIFSGYLRPKQAAYIGKIAPSFGREIELLEALMPKRLPYRSKMELG